MLPEAVAMYLAHVFRAAEADEVGHGRVLTASVAIACHFLLAGQPSPTEHPSCALTREISKRGSMQPDHVRTLVAHFAGPDASLPDLMIVACVIIMFAGFLRLNDLAKVSVRHVLLIFHRYIHDSRYS